MAKHADIPEFGNLQGVKVVVSAVSTAGPFAGELFAENGADVIWLEPPRGIDPYRWTQDGWGVQNERRNMRNLMLDVVSPEGHDVFLKLVETADIFIEASRGGQWEKWGYTDELLWEHNPKLVIGHMSGYGLTGDPAYVSLPGYDFTVNAFSGLMYLNGYKDGAPYMIQKFVTDYYAGLDVYKRQVHLDDVECEESDLVGEECKGFYQLMKNFEVERLTICAANVGMARCAYDEALRYAAQRMQFGKIIGSFQLVQEKLVDMRIKIENMQNLLYKTAWKKDNGESIMIDSSLVKRYTGQAAFEVIDDAMQIMGGIGYTHDCRISRLWRDQRVYRIMAGTEEIMVHTAGRALIKEAQ